MRSTAWTVPTIAAALSVLPSSCISIAESRSTWPEPAFYAGTVADVELIADGPSGGPCGTGAFYPILIVDAPLSFVVDTLLVPANIVLLARRREKNESDTAPPCPSCGRCPHRSSNR